MTFRIAIVVVAALLLLVSCVTATGNFTEHDIGMVPNYTLTLNIHDSDTGAPIITSVSVVASGAGSGSYTTSTGTVNISTAYGIVYITAAASGYNTATDSWLMDRDRTETISLTVATPNPVPSIVITPHDVKFIIRTVLGYPVVNATVNATYMETSGPFDWLLNWLGVPTSVDIQNASMSGHTGLDGAIVFSMVSTVKYDVQVTSVAGNASMRQFYPQDNEYTIWLGGNLTGKEFFPKQYNPLVEVRWVVNGTETGPTTGIIGSVYTDALNQTVQCHVVVNQSHSYGNFTNESTVIAYTYTPGGGASDFSTILSLVNQRDQSYLVHLQCNHTTFGNFTRDAGVTFPPGPMSLGIPEELLVYVGMGGLFFITLCFTRTLPGPAAIVGTAFFGWVFYLMGWWRDLAPGWITVSALTAFSAIAIMYNIMLRSKKVIFD